MWCEITCSTAKPSHPVRDHIEIVLSDKLRRTSCVCKNVKNCTFLSISSMVVHERSSTQPHQVAWVYHLYERGTVLEQPSGARLRDTVTQKNLFRVASATVGRSRFVDMEMQYLGTSTESIEP